MRSQLRSWSADCDTNPCLLIMRLPCDKQPSYLAGNRSNDKACRIVGGRESMSVIFKAVSTIQTFPFHYPSKCSNRVFFQKCTRMAIMGKYWHQSFFSTLNWHLLVRLRLLDPFSHDLLILTKSLKSKHRVVHEQKFKDPPSSTCSSWCWKDSVGFGNLGEWFNTHWV